MSKKWWWPPNVPLILFLALVLPPLGLLYATVIAEGLRNTFSFLGTPLHKMFFFLGAMGMGQFKGWNKIDAALPAACLYGLIVYVLLHFVLKLMLIADYQIKTGVDPVVASRLARVLGGLVFVFDMYLFLRGIRDQGLFGTEGEIVPAVLATAGYGAVLWAVGFIHILLERSEESNVVSHVSVSA